MSATISSTKRALASSSMTSNNMIKSSSKSEDFSAKNKHKSSSSSSSSSSAAAPITGAIERARTLIAASSSKKRRVVIETQPDTVTWNGAPAFSGTGDARLDLFFSGFVRECPKEKIVPMLCKSWKQSPEDTVRLILQSRDARSGKGERAVSMIAMLWLREHAPVTYMLNLPRFIEVGYFKDLLNIVVAVEKESMTSLGENDVLELEVMADYLMQDMDALSQYQCALAENDMTVADDAQKIVVEMEKENGGDGDGDGDVAEQKKLRRPRITLVGKWVPTEGTSYDKKCNGGLARRLARLAYGETNPKNYSKSYRQGVSGLRKYLVVVERLMCGKKWDDIEFGKCPSQCHNRNKKAFIKHCGERYQQYIDRVKTGADKICTTGLQPHELTQQCFKEDSTMAQETVEAQWTEMLSKLRKNGALTSALSVVDVSGSMSGIPMEVAVALGLVVADLTEGAFHNRMVTFSQRPQWHMVQNDTSLREKVRSLKRADWGMSTNLLAVFTMILDVAVKERVPCDDLPKTLFIFSDMQFDAATGGGKTQWQTTHRTVKKMYNKAGYTPPGIVYWNLQGKATAMPVDQYAENVACVSGFSAEMLKLFLQGVDMSPLAVLQAALENYEVEIEECER